VEEAVAAGRLEDLQATAAREAPLGPAIRPREPAVVADAAEDVGEEGRGIVDPPLGQRDVIEADRDGSVQLSGG